VGAVVSTRFGYIVHSTTGEAVPLERCLVVVGTGRGRPTVADKTNGRLYQTDPLWVWVPGGDESPDEVMGHPAFRLGMIGAAQERGKDLDVLTDLVGTFGKMTGRQ